MHLKIGILGERDGWKLLLQQIGIPHGVVTNTLLPNEFSVTVVSDTINDRESEMLRQYLAIGGAVLCSTKVYARIRQTSTHPANVEYLCPVDHSLFRSNGIIDIHTQCQLAWNANDLKTNRGSLAAYVGRGSKDTVLALPFDPSSLVFDQRAGIKSFYSSEQRLPFENVSLVSKGEIRALVSNCLEFLHHRRGLPYVHIWNFPYDAQSVFCFRIDTDYGTDEQMEQLSQVVHRNGISATWFVDAKSHAKSMRHYKNMHDQEIGLHCFEHQTFSDYERNFQNIRKAKEVLHDARFEAKGFAAPFGVWNKELGRAIADAGFEYSSEFSYDYDNVPSVPRLSRGEGVLQLPIHPICIGSLKRHSYSDSSMIRYFKNIIQRKLSMQEPILIYHHPRDGHHKVLDGLFQEIRQNHVPVKTMDEYAKWWKMRIASIPEFRYSNGNLHIIRIQRDKSLFVRITQPNGTEAVLPISEQIGLGTVHWKSKPAAWTMPDDYLRTRRFNYRILFVHDIDILVNFMHRNKQ